VHDGTDQAGIRCDRIVDPVPGATRAPDASSARLDDRVDGRRRRAASFDRFTGEQTQIFPIVTGDNLYANGYRTHEAGGDDQAR